MAKEKHPEILHDLLMAVGRVEGGIAAIKKRQEEQTRWISSVETRLRVTEKKSIVNSVITSGIVVGVGFAIKQYFKTQ